MLRLSSQAVKAAIKRCTCRWLAETADSITENAKKKTAVDTGKTRNGWSYSLNFDDATAIVGNPVENAVWEEFGTGEYALSGNGRKGGWVYKGKDGEFHFTYGKPPRHTLQRAYEESRGEAVLNAEKIFREVSK